MALIFRGGYRILRQCLQPSSLLMAQRPFSDTVAGSDFRTSEENPANHTLADVGKFYKIPQEVALEQLFKFGGFPKEYVEQCRSFKESCLMIRKPGLEIIHYLENADYTQPVNKYLLWDKAVTNMISYFNDLVGRYGNGKSLILCYVLHYAYKKGWLIVHLPWFSRWLTSPKEVTMSQTREGFVDLNARATEWLAHFKLQNLKILSENQLPVKNDYTWNIRESSKAGDSLLSLVEYGIMRGSFSSEVVVAILKEIKELSKSGQVRTLVVIDGYNAFFHNRTAIKDSDRKLVPPRKVSFLNSFYEISHGDWHNGAVLLTADSLAVKGHNESVLPLYQLTLEGFEYIFPFVPIEVEPFSDKEFYNMLRYYKDRGWMREEGGDEELKFLSCQNGYELMRICAPL